jgi:hypothetical protein
MLSRESYGGLGRLREGFLFENSGQRAGEITPQERWVWGGGGGADGRA